MIPEGVGEIFVSSSIDGSHEPSLIFLPPETAGAPLLVGLHTWSHDRFNQLESLLPTCRERGWGLLLPEFRGPNLADNPRARQACASGLAQQDVLDAVAAVLALHPLDPERLFLLGGSGGGHMALMLAARAPGLWRGVSAWTPIVDLAAWHDENPDYAANLAACCGGCPGSSADVDREYRERSPITVISELALANLSLHHGRHDPVVSFRQSWRLAQELETLGPERFYFDIFDGGHELRYDTALAWFDRLAAPAAVTDDCLTG